MMIIGNTPTDTTLLLLSSTILGIYPFSVNPLNRFDTGSFGQQYTQYRFVIYS